MGMSWVSVQHLHSAARTFGEIDGNRNADIEVLTIKLHFDVVTEPNLTPRKLTDAPTYNPCIAPSKYITHLIVSVNSLPEPKYHHPGNNQYHGPNDESRQ